MMFVKFVKETFYVDDALISAGTADEMISLLKNTEDRIIQGGGIRLHKIVSKSEQRFINFSTKDLA